MLSYFLGLEFSTYSTCSYISQATYACEILARVDLTDTETSITPLEQNFNLLATDGDLLSNPTLYRQVVGSPIYLIVTRPDIAYAVHVVSKFMSAPITTHFVVVLHILRYVKGTLFHGLYFSTSTNLIFKLILMLIGQVISLIVTPVLAIASFLVL